MSIFSEAKQLFDNGDYELALNLYEKAGKTYGWELVEYHINRCRELVSEQHGLDKITQLLIANHSNYKSDNSELVSYYHNLCRVDEQEALNSTNKLAFDSSAFYTDITVPPVSANDFTWHKSLKSVLNDKPPALSIIIPTFNRPKLLQVTLACLTRQETNFDYEVIVADDGSSEDIISVIKSFEHLLQLKYVRQADLGYQLCAVRNLGLRAAKFHFVAILDCDMAPDRFWVETYILSLIENEDVAYIGPRKYVDTSSVVLEDVLSGRTIINDLPEIPARNELGRVDINGVSKDWRLMHFEETQALRLSRFPFRFFSCGNVAFAKKWLDKVGWFDEEFSNWGGEDNEFGYRLYRAGCFFKSLDAALAFHQEPPGAENETDRNAGKKITSEIVAQKVPLFYRKPSPIEKAVIYKTKLVTVFVSGEYSEDSLVSAVNSLLNQTLVDLEVRIISTDLAPEVKTFAQRNYRSNPRVHIIKSTSKNGEIWNSDELVNSCNSYYIGFVKEPYILPPNSVQRALDLLSEGNSLDLINVSEVGTGGLVLCMFSSRAYNLFKNANILCDF